MVLQALGVLALFVSAAQPGLRLSCIWHLLSRRSLGGRPTLDITKSKLVSNSNDSPRLHDSCLLFLMPVATQVRPCKFPSSTLGAIRIEHSLLVWCCLWQPALPSSLYALEPLASHPGLSFPDTLNLSLGFDLLHSGSFHNPSSWGLEAEGSEIQGWFCASTRL